MRAVSLALRRRRFCGALRCAVAAPPRRRRRRSDRTPPSSPARIRMRVPARVAKVVAMSDGVAIAIAMFLRDHLRYVAVCVLWRRVFGSLVVASLSRRVAIVVGYFRPRTRLLGGRGGSESPPRVRPPDRPTVYLTDRHCTRASLLHGNQPSQRGGCCGRVRQSHQPPRIARTCARSWCVVPVIGPPAPWLRVTAVLGPALMRLSVRVD